MALAKQSPVIANPMIAREALLADLPRVLKARGASSLEGAGWRGLHDHGIILPVTAQRGAAAESYHLRLEFYYYPDWPPSAQFVNPETTTFNRQTDLYWLPKIEGSPEIHVHEHHDQVGGQLICCSATLEFYKMLHEVKPEHLWDHQKHNFALTINQIEWALNSPFYKGRFREQVA